ncbi:TPA: type II/IV secretion system protein [Vibrio parahaemolyticus]|uniref:GspE/PulE family protein n=1 Tax=Vibrio parahaemolyticus TaxID=670 RepID=UPI003AB06256|nr:type II/IV secretion system protein [Vibrio parahaemolyticus]HCG6647435.1 type II/IV secretion system protein [Vibrio parahaemolyticus]
METVACLKNLGVSEEQILQGQNYQQDIAERLEKIMVNMGVLEQEQLPHFYSDLLNLPLYDPLIHEYEISHEAILHFDIDKLFELGTLPFRIESGELMVAITDPLDLEALQYWQTHSQKVNLLVCGGRALSDLKARIEAEKEENQFLSVGGDELARLRELAFGAPTVNLVNNLIVKGIKLGASDLHIEPVGNRQRARYRVDGVLHEVDSIPAHLQQAVLSRIKILSGMDIAEKRRPQDGKIETRVAGKELDIRCSSLPLGDGESMVMRFLLKSSTKFDMADLGYEPDLVAAIQRDIARTSGVILMTGPTGSGKTTSLYSFLNQLNQPDVKIITLEDPVEYQLDGVNQVQVRSDIGFDFSAGLRSIVRQDPDIIMVGEIRDQETARIAMQSSLTGHLVFSTVHTNDAPSTYTRLLDLGIEDYLLNASLVSIMAQRLVRTLCSHCKEEAELSELIHREDIQQVLQKWSSQERAKPMKAVGCEHCGGSGYSGRMAILEYLPCDEGIQSIDKGANFLTDARKHMYKNGFRTLKQDGLLKVLNGYTTLDEVLRVAG